MDSDMADALARLESRISAVEGRFVEGHPSKQLDKSVTNMAGGLFSVPLGVAFFSWLAGGPAWAWAATGAIGVAAIAVAGLVLRRGM
jgi:hypothetical protein